MTISAVAPAIQPTKIFREVMPLTDKPNLWGTSRKLLNRLFEGYYRDYGKEAGGLIVKAIIDVLGGCRLTVPERPCNSSNGREMWFLFNYLCEQFGDASGKEIMRAFILELKGQRVSFPSHQDLYREDRNRKIRSMFTGSNYKELSTLFDLDVSHVWRIVNGD
jgi:hypothetical protein